MATGLFTLKQQVLAIREGGWPGQPPTSVNYLVVAGGGGGGKGNGGGGGAGGLLQGNFPITPGTSYTVTVGSGGSGATSYVGTSGGNSVFGAISSTGGGGGGGGTSQAPLTGGSGGGAGTAGALPGASGVSGQGNAGGASIASGIYPGGGGGGAGTVGLAGGSTGGNGGAGAASDVSGSRVTYAGGGGGGTDSGTAGTGGAGGGGSGGSNAIGSPGATNAGGGGGGAGFTNGTAGGNGGSGIVIVSYPGSTQWFTGGVVNYYNGNVVHTFTQSGTLAPAAPTQLSTTFQVSRSLRFNSADSAYLSRTPASAGNTKTWTLSVWVKRGSLGAFNPIYSAAPASPRAWVLFDTSNRLDFRSVDSTNTEVIRLTTTQVFRDPSAWYHIVVAQDTTQAISSNRLKMYVNGVQITAFTTATYPNQNISNLAINDALEQNYGRYVNSPSDGYLSAYLAETYMVDGQALEASVFGQTNADTGAWEPKPYSGAYGTNGFYLNFSDNSNTTAATLGKDYSGNGNNWTPNNFSVSAGAGNDSLVDSPTSYGTDTGAGGEVRGNYCTLNPLNNAASLFNGNLDSGTASAIANWLPTSATLGVSSGKWYWEVRMNSAEYLQVGIFPITYAATSGTYPGSASTSGYGYQSANGNKYVLGTGSSYGATFTTGDVIGVALDLDAGTLVFYKNNVSQGTAASSISGTFVPGIAVYNSTGASTVANCNFGQRPFAYTAPSGFKALCTQNLPTPTIGATSTTQANDYFNVVLWTGTGGGRTITGVGFQPDFVWGKGRSGSATYPNLVWDAVRGTNLNLTTNNTGAEENAVTGTGNGGIGTSASDGFTIVAGTSTADNLNALSPASTYVAWAWKANGAGSSNTAGSITSTVSANTTSGFSVATFTKDASVAQTIGHGLGVAPSMIIVKTRGSSGYTGWAVWHTSIGIGNYLELNTTAASQASTTIWNNTLPTSTVFSMGTAWTASSNSMVAYCFAEVPGYSKFGSYTGNGSTDGTFVYTGFRPAYLLIKRTDTTGDWIVWDAKRNTYNALNSILYPNLSSAEATAASVNIDFLSNGFKLRASSSVLISGDFIYAAFAESPFKYALAR